MRPLTQVCSRDRRARGARVGNAPVWKAETAVQALRVRRRSHRTERHARLLIIRMARIYRALFKGARSTSPPPRKHYSLARWRCRVTRVAATANLRPSDHRRTFAHISHEGNAGGGASDPPRLPERTAGRAPSSKTATFHPESSSIQHPPPLVPLL